MDEGEALVRLAAAEARKATGADDAARDTILLARDRLRESARGIVDPAWRESFLEKVEEHRRTLELAAIWI